MRKFFPLIVLFLLAPFIAEFLLGATPLSNIQSLVLVTPLYGGGALLIRELVRRRSLGWLSIVLLGVAYGIAEEGLAIQSLFSPTLFNAASYGGRWLGVNWIWTLYLLAYHAVVSISIPILLTELLFPAVRREPWTSAAGLVVVALLYLIGLVGTGAIYRLMVTPGYSAPALLLVVAAVVVIVLAVLALTRIPARTAAERGQHLSMLSAPGEAVPTTGNSPSTPPEPRQTTATAPGAVWVGVLAFLAFAAVLQMLGMPQPLRVFPLVLVPVVLYGILVALVVWALRRWTAPGAGWNDRHSLALVIGVVLVVILDGFFFVLPNVGTSLDRLVQGIAGIVTLVLLGIFAVYLSNHRVMDEALHPSSRP